MNSFPSFLVCQFLFFNAEGADVFHRLRLLFPPINVLAVSQSTSPASKPTNAVFGEAFLHRITSHQTVYCLLRGARRDRTKAVCQKHTDLRKRTTRNHHTWKYQWPQHQQEHHSTRQPSATCSPEQAGPTEGQAPDGGCRVQSPTSSSSVFSSRSRKHQCNPELMVAIGRLLNLVSFRRSELFPVKTFTSIWSS